MLKSVLGELKLSAPSLQHHQSQRSQTAWLDGLRGYAALFVFFCHFSFVYWSNLRYAYATSIPQYTVIPNGTYYAGGTPAWNGTNVKTHEPMRQTYPIQLPVVRLLVDGDPMVVVFFLVSGYSISLKPISLIRKGPHAHSKLLGALASSVFRRPIRLLLPPICSTLLVVFATTIGLYSYPAKFASNYFTFHQYFEGWAYESTPRIAASLNLQMLDWFHSMRDLIDLWTHFHWTMSLYDIHLWTIPVELRCSFLLFLAHLGTSHLHVRSRLVLISASIVLTMTWGDQWEMALFFTGMLLCEIDMIHPPSQAASPLRVRHVAALLGALYLLSMPLVFARFTPLYRFLALIHIPGLRNPDQSRFWQSLGAALLVILVARVPAYRDFFSNTPSRYLGRISYALYLVHGPICRCLSYSLAFRLWTIVGREGSFKYNLVVAMTACIVLPVTICAANVFCRRVDEPIVRFSRRVEEFMKGEVQEEEDRGRMDQGWMDSGWEEEQALVGRGHGPDRLAVATQLGFVGRPSLS